MKSANKPMQKRCVEFLLAGVQKSGTTTLHAYLKEHPQIGMANKKELHFFNNDLLFESGFPDYDYYHSFFDMDEACKIHGEATPAYIYNRDAPKRIWQYNPNMKIIVILRNPINRAYSHWNMEVSRGADTLSFSDAIRQESKRCREALPSQHYVYSYIDRGYYSGQIRELWRFFKKEQTLILKYDHLRDDPEAVLFRLFNFLGVDGSYAKRDNFRKKILHKASYKEAMSEEARALLTECYKNEILQLEYLLDLDFSDWLA